MFLIKAWMLKLPLGKHRTLHLQMEKNQLKSFNSFVCTVWKKSLKIKINMYILQDSLKTQAEKARLCIQWAVQKWCNKAELCATCIKYKKIELLLHYHTLLLENLETVELYLSVMSVGRGQHRKIGYTSHFSPQIQIYLPAKPLQNFRNIKSSRYPSSP